MRQEDVGIQTLRLGFEQAFSRFVAHDTTDYSADSSPESDRRNWQRAYLPVFEALNWAVALDDYLDQDDPEWWESLPGGEVMRGVRFARNRIHHQWADAFGGGLPVSRWLGTHKPRPTRATDPLSYGQPSVYGRPGFAAPRARWHWSPVLPDGKPDPKGEAMYRDHVAGEPVRAVLYRLRDLFLTMDPSS